MLCLWVHICRILCSAILSSAVPWQILLALDKYLTEKLQVSEAGSCDLFENKCTDFVLETWQGWLIVGFLNYLFILKIISHFSFKKSNKLFPKYTSLKQLYINVKLKTCKMENIIYEEGSTEGTSHKTKQKKVLTHWWKTAAKRDRWIFGEGVLEL